MSQAAELKSDHAIAYADAFAGATALKFKAAVATSDLKSSRLSANMICRCSGSRSRADRPPRGVRLNETRCAGTQRNGTKQTEVLANGTA